MSDDLIPHRMSKSAPRSDPPISWNRWSDSSTVHFDASLTTRLNEIYYRYATLAEAIDLIAYKQITLLDPREWRDKYERYITDQVFGKSGPFEGTNIFSKCLSAKSSSEALWRLFATGGPVIRYGLHLKDLLEALNNANQANASKIFVADVRYEYPQVLRARVRTLKKTDLKMVGRKAAEFLFHKRDAFDYEKELRIVMTTKRHTEVRSLTLSNFKPKKLTRVLIDPYAPKWQAAAFRRLFKETIGYSGRVEQSIFDDDV